MDNKSTLILGGARSGKSSYAEKLALSFDLEPIYIATAQAKDDEMVDRIRHHKLRRNADWKTIEEPLNISKVIVDHSSPHNVILIDCLTLWLSNIFAKSLNFETEIKTLVEAVAAAKGPIIFVSNEVGQGIVPINELARNFRDEAGRLNQQIAASVANVYVIMAGLPLPIKEDNKLLTERLK